MGQFPPSYRGLEQPAPFPRPESRNSKKVNKVIIFNLFRLEGIVPHLIIKLEDLESVSREVLLLCWGRTKKSYFRSTKYTNRGNCKILQTI